MAHFIAGGQIIENEFIQTILHCGAFMYEWLFLVGLFVDLVIVTSWFGTFSFIVLCFLVSFQGLGIVELLPQKGDSPQCVHK